MHFPPITACARLFLGQQKTEAGFFVGRCLTMIGAAFRAALVIPAGP